MMGIPTVVIGLLPTYATIGLLAPLLLSLCRFSQGLGLGGEWGGAVLIAVENAQPERRAFYGMFPQLGAPLGFFLSGGVFLVLTRSLTDAQFVSFGWRLPFLASSVLVLVGLYVRLALAETPSFRDASARGERVRSPMLTVLFKHPRQVVAGVLACLSTFVLFYLITVFALSWGTTRLGFTRGGFLLIELLCTPLFAATIPVSAHYARHGRRSVLLWATAAIGVFGLIFGPLFSAGTFGAIAMVALGMMIMGLTWAPLGTAVSELFPTAVRYTGSSLCLSLAGVLGASSAPYIATSLARTYGLDRVGTYLVGSAVLTAVGLLMMSRAHDE